MISSLKKILKFTNISNINRISFRQDINILRAVAVLVVVFYHAEINLFKGGWLGVDIFFVISGFLISNIIISELNKETFNFRGFYFKRLKRILPALTSTLLFSIPLAYFLLAPLAMLEYGKSLISSLFFFSNYYFNSLDFYNSEPSRYFPLLHTWSLSIEEQFYILFPGFLFLIFKYRRRYIFAFVSSTFLLSIFANSLTPGNEKFYLLQFRIWELLLGCLVMILSQNLKIRNTGPLGLLIILFSVFFFDDSLVNSIEPKLVATLGSSLILVSRPPKLISDNILISGIKRIGLISYSLYLFHQPVFAFFRIYLKKQQIQESFLITSLILIILLFISDLNYKFVEQRFIRATSINLKYISYIILITLFSYFVSSNNGITEQYEETYSSLEKYYLEAQREGVRKEFCNGDTYYCEIGDMDLPSIIVIGDSHLTTLTSYLYKNIDFKKNNLVIITEQGCPFFLRDGVSNKGKCPHGKKDLYVFSKINNNATVIFGGRFPRYLKGNDFETSLGSIRDDIEGSPLLINDINDSIEYLSKNSKRLILVYPIPEFGIYPLEFYLYEYVKIGDSINYDRKYWEEYSSEINVYLDSVDLTNVEKVKSNDIFCNDFIKDNCTASMGDTIFYWDDDHLTYDGASFLGDEILNLLKK
jgi:peptidoglycan/LPS O-acetylase OafA/YrhL